MGNLGLGWLYLLSLLSWQSLAALFGQLLELCTLIDTSAEWSMGWVDPAVCPLLRSVGQLISSKPQTDLLSTEKGTRGGVNLHSMCSHSGQAL